MPDYSNNTGRSFTNASGTVRLNNSVLIVRKGKPSKVAYELQHAYSFGNPEPVAHVTGKKTIEAIKLTVALKEWELLKKANPDYASKLFQTVVSFTEPVLGSFSFNHQNCRFMSADPSEFDGETTAEARIDIELLPLSVK